MKSQTSLYSFIALSKIGISALCAISWALPVNAEDTTRIDLLTEQWLNTERQTSHLQKNWKEQQPVLEQRIKLLNTEKNQLKEILEQSSDSQSGVDDRRTQLLGEQDLLEHQQQALSQALKLLQNRAEEMRMQLPPPLEKVWRDEQNALGEKPEASMQLQVVLAQLSRLADFDRRISVHEAPITRADGKQVLVKQLYLGVGMAWFVSSDGTFSGWGQLGNEGWQWHGNEKTNDKNHGVEISNAIAIFEKQQQANFVGLPVKLSNKLSANEGVK